MIARSDIFPAGQFGKPHGVNGEINAVFDDDIDPAKTDCVIVDIDGIYVPFFIKAIRPKGRDNFLLTVDGMECDADVKLLANRHIFMRENDREAVAEAISDDTDGFYAADLIGFTMTDDATGRILGNITDIDDSTANVLFVVEQPDDRGTLLVPVADEFITEIDTNRSVIAVSLPDGLID